MQYYFDSMMQHLQKVYEVPIRIRWTWHCEKDTTAQAFDKFVWNPRNIYQNAAELKSGRAWCVVCKGMLFFH